MPGIDRPDMRCIVPPIVSAFRRFVHGRSGFARCLHVDEVEHGSACAIDRFEKTRADPEIVCHRSAPRTWHGFRALRHEYFDTKPSVYFRGFWNLAFEHGSPDARRLRVLDDS
jgi:hypothetical protein